MVNHLQLRRFAPVDATAMNVRPYLELRKCVTLMYSHTQAAKLAHGLDPSVVKAQTLTKHRTTNNWAYWTPKSVHTTIRAWQERKERSKSVPAIPRYVPIHPIFGSLITNHDHWTQTTQQIRQPAAGCRPLNNEFNIKSFPKIIPFQSYLKITKS